MESQGYSGNVRALILFLALLFPATADAYVINTGGGGELHWDQSLVFRDSDGRIPFWIQYEGSDELSFVQNNELRLAFLQWASVSGADLHFFEQRVDLREPEFHAGTETDSDKKALLFYVEEGWDQDEFIIASTLITFDAGGRIIDADIGFNADLYEFSMNDEPSEDEVDLLSVATHEVGHFLGIGHSEVPGATMWATYEGGVAARTLSDDDVAAIEYLYPCGEMCRSIVDWRPRLDRGCSVGGASPVGWLGALGLFLMGGLLARRARNSRAPVLLVAVLAAAGSLLLPAMIPDAESTLVERIDLSRMSDAADRAVVATVRSVQPFARGAVWSRIELSVEEDLLGSGVTDLVIEQPGGLLEAPLPSGAIGTLAMGYPSFDVNERVVVFLREDAATGASRVVGLSQGKMRLAENDSLERDLRGMALTRISRRAPPVTVDVPPSLSELRLALSGSR